MRDKELKPCPFCNGNAIVKESKFGFNAICCYSCGARIIALYMDDAIEAWNRRVADECCEKSCKEENATLKPLVPKWVSHYSGGESLDVSISQYKKLRFRIYGSSNFKYHCDCTVINFISDKDSYIFEEVGEFDTLEEAKTKANECIRKLGERLVYFSNNIKTEE